MEAIAYNAYWASTDLAEERGPYSTFKGSLWDRGILPLDTLELLKEERGGYVEFDDIRDARLGRAARADQAVGMRNSNCLAIAPTATIANITGVSQCIEPTYQNLYVKSNLSGEFTVVNEFLVRDLKKLNLWDEVMIADLKYFDGSLAKIDRTPADCAASTPRRSRSSRVARRGAARRQKWVDQSQSLNIYMAAPRARSSTRPTSSRGCAG